MIVSETNYKIEQNKAQYNLDRQTATIFALYYQKMLLNVNL